MDTQSKIQSTFDESEDEVQPIHDMGDYVAGGYCYFVVAYLSISLS